VTALILLSNIHVITTKCVVRVLACTLTVLWHILFNLCVCMWIWKCFSFHFSYNNKNSNLWLFNLGNLFLCRQAIISEH